MARAMAVLGVALSIAFFAVWFGPKSGEGFSRGWGEAMAMYLIMAVQLVSALLLGVRPVYRRYRSGTEIKGIDVMALLSCSIPLAWLLLFNLLRDR